MRKHSFLWLLIISLILIPVVLANPPPASGAISMYSSITAAYKFDNQSAKDYFGNYTGTIIGGMVMADGINGTTGGTFDDNDDQIRLNTTIPVTVPMTAAAWIRAPETNAFAFAKSTDGSYLRATAAGFLDRSLYFTSTYQYFTTPGSGNFYQLMIWEINSTSTGTTTDLIVDSVGAPRSGDFGAGAGDFTFIDTFGTDRTSFANISMDEIIIFNRKLTYDEMVELRTAGATWNGADDVTPPKITQNTYNHSTAMNSGNQTVWRTNQSQYSYTFDSTPTVIFDLDEVSNCSISLTNFNHTAMIANDANTLCATTSTTSMTCTVPLSQELAGGNQSLYLACIDVTGNQNITSSSGALSVYYPLFTLNFTRPTTNSTASSNTWIFANTSASAEFLHTINITIWNSSQRKLSSANNTTTPFWTNFTGLDAGTYYLNATGNDTGGNQNSTETRQINITLSVNDLLLNTTRVQSNDTNVNLTAYWSINSPANNITNWVLNGESALLLNLPFEGPANGTSTKDYSTFNNNANEQKSALWIASTGYGDGGAYNLTTTSYLSIANSPALNKTTNLTGYARLKRNTDSVDDGILGQATFGTGSNRKGWNLIFDDISDKFCVGLNNNNATTRMLCQTAAGSATDFARHDVFVTSLNDNFTFWLDGDKQESQVYPITKSNNDLVVGEYWIDSLGNSLDGWVTIAHIWNRSLSAEQIKAIYNNRSDLIVSQETEVGQNWSVLVTPADGTNNGTTSLSNNVTILESKGITLYFNFVNDTQKYEYYTVANITANLTSCTGNNCEVCVAIDDAVNNVSLDLINKNYVCNNQTVNFLYNITTLRVNSFNNSLSNLSKNVSNGNSVFIALDNRTDIDLFQFNLTSFTAASENVSVDVDRDGDSDALLSGYFTGTRLLKDNFYSDSVKLDRVNLSRSSAGTKTIYANVSTSGFSQSDPVLNFSFRVDGFNIDENNEFHFADNFSNNSKFNGTFGSTLSLMSPLIDFYDNDSSDWSVVEGEADNILVSNPFTSDAHLTMQTDDVDSNNPGTQNHAFQEDIAGLELRKVYQFQTNMTTLHGATTYPNACVSWSRQIDFYDGTNTVNLYYTTGSIGASSSSTVSTSLDLRGVRRTATDWDIYYGNEFQSTVSLSSLNPNVNPKLKFRLNMNSGCSGRTVFTSSFQVWNISVSGISLLMNSSNYSTAAANYSSLSLNITNSSVSRALLTADVFRPTNTSVRYFLSNNNQTTWEEVTNGSVHVFTSTGRNVSARFQVDTDNVSRSPIVRSFNVDVNPSAVGNLTVDVGSDGTADWNYTGTLNSTTSPQHFRTNGSSLRSYVLSNCALNVTCYVPLSLSFGTAGTVQIRDFNLTTNPNPINITTSLVETFNPLNLTFTYTGGLIQMDSLKLDFKGSRNISFFTYYVSDPLVNFTQVMQVRYSKFNISLPTNISFWEVFAKTRNDTNITPFGQTNSTSIWNISSLAYDDPFSSYIKTNSTLNSCLNITFGNTSSQLGVVYLNTSVQTIHRNISTLQNNGTGPIWNYVDLLNCTNRYEIPWFHFSTKCENCVNTTNFEETNYIME